MVGAQLANEMDQLSRSIVPRSGRLIVMGVYIACVVLDLVALFALEIAPTTLGRLACLMRPIGLISSPFFSEELLGYAATQCTEMMQEPSISIIFLSIKLALGMLLVPLVCLFVIFRPQGLVALCSTFREHADNRAFYLHELKRWVTRLSIVIALDVLCILLTSQRTVTDFDTSLFHKLFLEDGMAVLIPATIFTALVFLVLFGAGRPPVAGVGNE